MNLLALDTSFRIASVCIMSDGKVIADLSDETPLQHSTTLLPLCEAALKKTGMSLSDMDIFVSTLGPGSFTGIRIGISVIKGFAFAGDKPCIGVSSLKAAAFMADSGKRTVSLIKARENEYYCAEFQNGTQISPDRIIDGGEAADLLELAAAAGDGARDFDPSAPLQCALGAAKAALSCIQDAGSCHLLTPIYLKPSQAERLKKEGSLS